MKTKFNLQAKKTGILIFCLVFLLSTFLPQVGVHRLKVDKSSESEFIAKIEENYGKVPLIFEKNVGQTDDQVKFLNRTGNTTTYFTPTETVMVRSQSFQDKEDLKPVNDVLRMSLNGANDNLGVSGLDEQQTKSNYFTGNNPEDWQTDIANYGKIKYSQIYPGIDMVYYGNNDNLEHDFIVAPGSDPSQISFTLSGPENVYVDEDGNLIAEQENGRTVFAKPIVYQDSKENTINSSYIVTNNSVEFALADYDSSKELVIDPVMLVYSTYLGGSNYDDAGEITVNASGEVYVTGQTYSTDFPTSSPYQGSLSGTIDAFITKLSASGTSVQYSTYIGGSGSDYGYGIAVDLDGNAYVSGSTDSSDFPTANAYQNTNAGSTDAFLLKINPTGSTLTYSTYLGGSSIDSAYGGVALDSSENAYLRGYTNSSDFPTANAYQAANGGGVDSFVTKFNSSGSALVYSTYLGGSGTDGSNGTGGIVIDESGSAYVTGSTTSSNFPTVSAFQSSYAALGDAYITKFSPDGTSLIFSTYLGGSGDVDLTYGIDIDSSNNVYVAGYTGSTDFPTASPYQASKVGGYDAFVTKLDNSGASLVYSTYVGGSAAFNVLYGGIAVDGNGNAIISGHTNSSSYPTANAYQETNAGGNDIFVTKFNSSGSALVYSTYLGGGSNEGSAGGVAVDLAGNAYVFGSTGSSDFPTTSAYQSTYAGNVDTFIFKLTENSVVVTGQVNPTLTFTVDDTTCDLGVISASSTGSCIHTMTAGTNASNGYTISYLPTTTLTSGSDTITETGTTGATSSQGSEQFGLNLKDNATPNIGAEPSGGVGVASTNYATADTFSFTPSGAQVAASSTLSDTTTYTVSYIANVANTTEAGNYSTVQTYNIVASY